MPEKIEVHLYTSPIRDLLDPDDSLVDRDPDLLIQQIDAYFISLAARLREFYPACSVKVLRDNRNGYDHVLVDDEKLQLTGPEESDVVDTILYPEEQMINDWSWCPEK